MADGRPKNPEQARREERLAAALRENLRRRKAQVRARACPAGDEPEEPKPDGDR
jgi:hypothetical protein